MCMAEIAIAASVLGTATSVYGQIQQANAQSAQYSYQRQVNEQNARTAQWKADDARVRGQEAEVAQRRKAGLLMEDQKTALAGQGFDMGDETGSMVLADTAMLSELDAQTIRKNASREAWGYEVEAANFKNQANLSGMASSNASTSGWINAGSSLFSGASSVADKWSKYKGLT